MKLLLTGFERFGDYSFNVAEKLVEELNRMSLEIIDGVRVEIVGVKLPINFKTFRGVAQTAINDHKPDVVVGLGMDFKDQPELAFELHAHRNPEYGDFLDENNEEGPDLPLDNGPEILIVPNEELFVEALQKLENVSISKNAGKHMCETILRDLIKQSNNGSRFCPAFVHVQHTPGLEGEPEHMNKVDYELQKNTLIEVLKTICRITLEINN